MRKMFLENLPKSNHNGGSIDWKNSIGQKINLIMHSLS